MAKTPKSKTNNLRSRLIGRGDDKQVLWRWTIGPTLRKRGYKELDLWADGPAFTLQDSQKYGFDTLIPVRNKGRKPMSHREAATLARHLTSLATQTKTAIRPDAHEPSEKTTRTFRVRTVSDLVSDYTDWAEKRVRIGKLSPKTWATYASCLKTIERWWAPECPAGFRASVIEDWHDELGQEIGEHGAYATIAQLIRILNWAGKRDDWLSFLPDQRQYTGLDISKPGGRLRVGLNEEMACLLETFDKHEPAMGDALVLLLWTCMRVHDALTLTPRAFAGIGTGNATLAYQQQKTKTIVTIPLKHILAMRITDMMARQSETINKFAGLWRDQDPLDIPLILNQDDGLPYARTSNQTGIGHHRGFNERWNALRDLAGEDCPSLIGKGKDRLNRPWTPFKAQDTRDTSATRLVLAGCTDAEVGAWHGSDANTIKRLRKHYIDLSPDVASNTGNKLERLANDAGMTV